MDEGVEFLEEAVIFSILDANSVYWHVKIDESYWDETAFKSHHELYIFVSLSSGLKNAPEKFKRPMDVSLSPVKWQYASV